MSKLRDIADKVLSGHLQLSSKELAAERVKICETCDEFARTTRQCKICWCFIDLKTEFAAMKCPAGKW